ncbi:hypothetical protein CCACVL1_19737 [Corchorus capsularis]|uniref:Uncharacterized protein n=1 Tax=Corchorus capsularis TaxID=210143 RepID=A0A1R3HFD3_COCAP|nr:hypothetical protein CCACVL1_19737 [Corchorus capsularis]
MIEVKKQYAIFDEKVLVHHHLSSNLSPIVFKVRYHGKVGGEAAD